MSLLVRRNLTLLSCLTSVCACLFWVRLSVVFVSVCPVCVCLSVCACPAFLVLRTCQTELLVPDSTYLFLAVYVVVDLEYIVVRIICSSIDYHPHRDLHIKGLLDRRLRECLDKVNLFCVPPMDGGESKQHAD